MDPTTTATVAAAVSDTATNMGSIVAWLWTELQFALAIGLNRYTILVAGGIFVLLRALASTPLNKVPLYRNNILPVLPELIGVLTYVFAELPTNVTIEGGDGFVFRAALGLWCAYLAQKGRKLLGQTILKDDKVSEEAFRERKVSELRKSIPAPPPPGPVVDKEKGESA